MSARRIVACAIVIAAALPATVTAQLARLRGRVFDSVTALPLVGARVEFVNADDRARVIFSTTSDSLGRFVVDSVARGRYIAGFLHPMLDSLGLAFSQRQLTVSAAARYGSISPCRRRSGSRGRSAAAAATRTRPVSFSVTSSTRIATPRSTARP